MQQKTAGYSLTPPPAFTLTSLTSFTDELFALNHYLTQNGIGLVDHLLDRRRDFLCDFFNSEELRGNFNIGETSFFYINNIHVQIKHALDSGVPGGYPFRKVFFDIFECIREFGIHIQAEDPANPRPLNQLPSIPYSPGLDASPVMSWLINALGWINEVICPLLINLLRSEEFSKLAARYVLYKKYGKELGVDEASLKQLEERVKGIFYEYIEKMKLKFKNEHFTTLPTGKNTQGFTHDLVKNILDVSQIRPLPDQKHFEKRYRPHDVATMIPIAVDEISMLDRGRYEIKIHRNDSVLMGMIVGFVFHAQQELNQSLEQKPIFNRLNAFFEQPFKSNVAAIISGFIFEKDLPSHRLKHAHSDMNAVKQFINTLIIKLRSAFVKIQLDALDRDIKKKRAIWMIPIGQTLCCYSGIIMTNLFLNLLCNLTFVWIKQLKKKYKHQ